MNDHWVVDFDDFSDGNTGFRWLFHLKQREPAFKATLFCVPRFTSPRMLANLKAMGWLEPAAHGLKHDHLECGSWDEETANHVLAGCEELGYAKVFRAPYWEISDATYRALIRRDWICADHPKNRERNRSIRTAKCQMIGCEVPAEVMCGTWQFCPQHIVTDFGAPHRIGHAAVLEFCEQYGQTHLIREQKLKVYECDAPGRVHGHIQNVCTNGLEEKLEYYESLHGTFSFISELPEFR